MVDPTNEETRESDYFVAYDHRNDQYRPAKQCSTTPLPLFMGDEEKYWRSARLDRTHVSRNDHGTIVVENGCMKGLDCKPTKCRGCMSSLKQGTGLFSHVLKLRTRRGCVLRNIFQVVCPYCNESNKWDPASECIHTIRNGREGGEFWCLLRYVTKLFPICCC
jgi:hypothetical protein